MTFIKSAAWIPYLYCWQWWKGCKNVHKTGQLGVRTFEDAKDIICLRSLMCALVSSPCVLAFFFLSAVFRTKGMNLFMGWADCSKWITDRLQWQDELLSLR